MTYGMMHNWIIFPKPPSLLKLNLWVKGYVCFSKDLLSRPKLPTETMDSRLNNGLSVQVIVSSDYKISMFFLVFSEFV